MTTICLLLMPDAHLLDIAAPAQVLGHDALGTRLSFIAADRSLQTAQGLALTALEPLPDTVEPGSWLVICGSRDLPVQWRAGALQREITWVHRMAGQFDRVAAICSGSLLAGAAGLFDGRRCTTHHDLIEDLRRLAPRAIVEEDCLYVEDGELVSSAGIATGLDLSLHLVNRHWGPERTLEVARAIVLYHRRAGSDSQLGFWLSHRNHVMNRIHRVQDHVLQSPADDWQLATLARIACVSERHLRRLFREATGLSLRDYLEQARFETARRLLGETRYPIVEVARRAGYASERSLRRAWQRREGQSPGSYRRSLVDAG